MEIVNAVAGGAQETVKAGAGKVRSENIYRILDRRDALTLAVSLADDGDLVLATGKGSEQAICVGSGRKVPWDEREVLRELLKNSQNRNP